MKITTLLFLAFAFALQGCIITGSFEHTDPKTGATGSLVIGHEFKPRFRADGKRVVPRE